MTTATSIPASRLVNVIPSVIAPAGNPLSLNAVFLTSDPSIPVGSAQAFPNALAVSNWFGPNANETAMANVYFNGFIGCTQLPSLLYFAQMNLTTAAPAYLRGGPGLTLAQVNALSTGTITVSIDGTPVTSATINLAAAASLSAAAALITTGFSGTAKPAVCTYDSLRGAFLLTSPTTGANSTFAFPTTAALATSLLLTQATGAVLSQGSAIMVPAAVMNAVVAATQNWATFATVTEPSDANALLLAQWVNAQNQRYAYVCGDSNALAIATPPQTGTLGAQTSAYNGVIMVYDPTGLFAALICGIAASTNFNGTQQSVQYAYRGQAGLNPNVTDPTTASNLETNGYNYYGSWGTATQQFQFLQTGVISGAWKWIDQYIEQIYLNANLQLSLLMLISQVGKIPYNQAGYNLIRAACEAPIWSFVNYGGIQIGVILSPAEIAEANAAAGADISGPLKQKGWYLGVTDPGSAARVARTTPNCSLWYVSGGAVRQITLASIEMQ